MYLPQSYKVDVGAFSGLFSRTTNSYKYLFFLSLLDAMERRYELETPTGLHVPLRELAVGMLVNAWYPQVFFRLSFGSQDQVARLLEPIASAHPLVTTFDRAGKARLTEHLKRHTKRQSLESLLRYVVSRLLRVYFRQELAGVRDAQVDQRIWALARERFESDKPLYRLHAAPSGQRVDGSLELHPDWALYLQENLAVVRGWAAWSWCQFLSAKNPNVPAVSEKLFPPAQRASLAPQDGFWRRVLEQRALRCIYSGEPLEARAYSLDHFLPWSFVLHDQLWNLVPVSRSANSAKSDRLPSLEYLQPFVQVQCQGLIITRKTADKRTWQRVSEPYLSGLRVSPATLDSASATGLEEALGQAFESTLTPLLSLAERMGFAGGWKYRQPA